MSKPLIESETEFLRRENAELRAENERLRGLLREIDDEMEHDSCYICARCRNATGHAPDCRLAVALECKP